MDNEGEKIIKDVEAAEVVEIDLTAVVEATEKGVLLSKKRSSLSRMFRFKGLKGSFNDVEKSMALEEVRTKVPPKSSKTSFMRFFNRKEKSENSEAENPPAKTRSLLTRSFVLPWISKSQMTLNSSKSMAASSSKTKMDLEAEIHEIITSTSELF